MDVGLDAFTTRRRVRDVREAQRSFRAKVAEQTLRGTGTVEELESILDEVLARAEKVGR